MKAVMKSVTPRICEKVANGNCTILVSKTAPKCGVPFKGYIYATKKARLQTIFKKGEWIFSDDHSFGKFDENIFVKDSLCAWQGKVVGEFVCDKVIKTCGWRLRGDTQQCAKRTTDEEAFPELACLTIDEIVKYAGSENREVCGLHISDLKIYGKPKELSEFYTIDESGNDCCIACVYHETPIEEMPCRTCTGERKYLYRPPQSYMYVEEL